MKSQKSQPKADGPRAQKIIVAMSGGVDSSVAAALLKKAGFDVTGVFMKLNNLPSSKQSEKRARNVAKALRIPFCVFDFRKEFKKIIIKYFLREYKKGVTPNPCIICNKEIKFGLLLEKALKIKADFVATGHYVRIKKYGKIIRLLKGKDKNKDQSYFLWKLNQKQLSRILFPVGNYTKPEVRKVAKRFKLPNFETPESQEVCFINTNINDFLAKYLKQKSGKIVDKNGKILGIHNDLSFYTLGQRKGIGLPAAPTFAKASAGKPYYVLDKDLKRNILVVTNNQKDLLKKELFVKNINWINGKEPKLPLKVSVKIRYRSKPALATIYKSGSKHKMLFAKKQRAITPGQSAVFYKGNELIGGGGIS